MKNLFWNIKKSLRLSCKLLISTARHCLTFFEALWKNFALSKLSNVRKIWKRSMIETRSFIWRQWWKPFNNPQRILFAASLFVLPIKELVYFEVFFLKVISDKTSAKLILKNWSDIATVWKDFQNLLATGDCRGRKQRFGMCNECFVFVINN